VGAPTLRAVKRSGVLEGGYVGAPTSPPHVEKRGWVVYWEVLTTGVLERCVAGVVLDPCGGQMVRSDVSLAVGYWHLGAWVFGRRICAD